MEYASETLLEQTVNWPVWRVFLCMWEIIVVVVVSTCMCKCQMVKLRKKETHPHEIYTDRPNHLGEELSL